MDFETPQTSGEITPELHHISFDTVNDMRKQQEASVYAAEMQASREAIAQGGFASSKTLREARQSAEAAFPEHVTSLLETQLDRDSDPDRYDTLFQLLKACSVDHMSTTKWLNGDIDADGNYDFTTSGRFQLRQALESMRTQPAELEDENAIIEDENDIADEEEVAPVEPVETDPIDHMSPEAQAVYTSLLAARKELARLSVARRQMIRKGGKKAEALAAEYEIAHEAHNLALQNVTSFYVKSYRDHGLDDTKIHEKVLPRLIKQHRGFTQAEYDLNQSDDSLRARAARFFAKRGALFGLSAISGAAIGTGARYVANTALMFGVGVTGGAAAGGLFAIKTTKNILLAKVRNNIAFNKEFDKRRAEDEKLLSNHLADNKNVQLDEAIRSIHTRIGEVITNRVEKDRKSNLRRAAFSTLIGGASAAAAFELVPVVEHAIGGWFHGPDDTHVGGAAPTTPGHTLPPGSKPYELPGHEDTKPHIGVTLPPSSTPTPGGQVQVEIPKGSVTIGGDNGREIIDGFNSHVTVEPGNGYIRELQDLAAQKHINLSLDQATDAYHHVLNSQGTDFFTHSPNGPHNYVFDGDNRISSPGPAIWDHAHIDAFNNWLHIQEAEGKIAS